MICKKCQNDLPEINFQIARIYNGKEYRRKVCIECTNKGKRKTKRGQWMTGEKRCHNCYKYKDLGEFRRVKKDGDFKLSGFCLECEEKHGRPSFTHENRYPAVNDRNDDHLCAFIGNYNQSHIRKVFKIL